MRQTVEPVLTAQCRQVIPGLVIYHDTLGRGIRDIKITLVISRQTQRLPQCTGFFLADFEEPFARHIEHHYAAHYGIADENDPLADGDIERFGHCLVA